MFYYRKLIAKDIFYAKKMLYRYSNLFKGTDNELNHIQIIHSIIHINQIIFKKNLKYRCLPDLGINKTKILLWRI